MMPRMAKRHRTFLLTLIVVAAAISAAVSSSFAARQRKALSRNETLQSKLQQNVTFAFDETPLEEILDYFRLTLEVNIVYDPPEDYQRDKLITLQVTNMRAENALRWAVKLAGLEHTLVEGAVYVSTHDRIIRMGPVYFRQYNVKDLLASPRYLRDRQSGGNNNDSGNANGGNNNDNDGGNNNAQGNGSDSGAEELLKVIVLFTGPENWDRVEVMGASSQDNNDENESREDDF